MAAHTKKSEFKIAGRRKGGPILEVVAFLQRAGEVARQRRALRRLDDAALKDFGASRADAWEEGGRPWWDLPPDRKE